MSSWRTPAMAHARGPEISAGGGGRGGLEGRVLGGGGLRGAGAPGHPDLGGGGRAVQRRTGRAPAPAAGRAAFAVGNEGDVDEAGGDGGRCVLDIDHERRATYRRAGCVLRLNAEVFGDLKGGRPAG